jgi:hypothetical protein
MDIELENKFKNAKDALDIVISELKAINSGLWINYFLKMEQCIIQRDVECLVNARDSVPMANMGGFLEFKEAYPALSKAHNNLSSTIGNLKVYHRYQINREHVDLS